MTAASTRRGASARSIAHESTCASAEPDYAGSDGARVVAPGYRLKTGPKQHGSAMYPPRHVQSASSAPRRLRAGGGRELIGRVTGSSPPSELTGALLERDAELRALDLALRNSAAGQGGIVLVEAATGLGKTRLLGEAAALAAGRGARVLSASGRDLERDLPFGVALQLFEKPVSRFGDPERERFLSGSAGLAAPLVLEGTPVPVGLSATLHGLYWLSANLAQERPLVLSIDDVHWCDPPTMRFLVYLAQRVEELPITVVLAVAAGGPPQAHPPPPE